MHRIRKVSNHFFFFISNLSSWIFKRRTSTALSPPPPQIHKQHQIKIKIGRWQNQTNEIRRGLVFYFFFVLKSGFTSLRRCSFLDFPQRNCNSCRRVAHLQPQNPTTHHNPQFSTTLTLPKRHPRSGTKTPPTLPKRDGGQLWRHEGEQRRRHSGRWKKVVGVKEGCFRVGLGWLIFQSEN